MNEPLLSLEGVHSGYGEIQVLWDVSLRIGTGQVVTLIGRNGMGKSTLVKTLLGQRPASRGRIRFGGHDVTSWEDYRIARLGVGLVPEGREVFPNLSVRENLLSGAMGRPRTPDGWTTERVYALLPRLKEREKHLGCNLSGGEQQMLAIGRALMTNPLLLVLDEATEGLSPLVRAEIWACLAELKKSGIAMLLIDKHLAQLARLADWHHVMDKGRVVWQGDSRQLAADRLVVQRHVSA